MQQLEFDLYTPVDSAGRALTVGCRIEARYGVRMPDGSLSSRLTGIVTTLTPSTVVFDGTTDSEAWPNTYRCCVRRPSEVTITD